MLEYLGICFVLYVILRAWKISHLRREICEYEQGASRRRRW